MTMEETLKTQRVMKKMDMLSLKEILKVFRRILRRNGGRAR